MKTLRFIPAIAALALLFGLTSCNKDSDGPDGSFKVRMTDNPSSYEALDVEIAKVEAYSSASGWVTLSNQARVLNVASLTNGTEAELAYVAKAEAGAYSKLRLTFGTNNRLSVYGSGPSGGSSGSLWFNLGFSGSREVEIAIDEEVSGNAAANVLLDFDVASSVIQLGTDYLLNPTIRVIHDETTGAKGQVKGAAHAFVRFSNSAHSYGAYIDANGRFLMRGMSPGTYDMEVMPANPMDDPALQPRTIYGVVIAQGEIKTVGDINF